MGESISDGDGDDIEAVKQVCDRGLRSVMELARAGNAKVPLSSVRFAHCRARYIARPWTLWAALAERQSDTRSNLG